MICVGLYPSKHLVKNRKYCFYINWFCNMSIHTCFKCLLFIFFECVCGHGNDWNICFPVIPQSADFPGCHITIHGKETDFDSFMLRTVLGRICSQGRKYHTHAYKTSNTATYFFALEIILNLLSVKYISLYVSLSTSWFNKFSPVPTASQFFAYSLLDCFII